VVKHHQHGLDLRRLAFVPIASTARATRIIRGDPLVVGFATVIIAVTILSVAFTVISSAVFKGGAIREGAVNTERARPPGS